MLSAQQLQLGRQPSLGLSVTAQLDGLVVVLVALALLTTVSCFSLLLVISTSPR